MKLSYASFLAAGLALLTDQAAGDLATNRRLGSTSPEAATDEQLERALVEVEGMSMPIEAVDEEEAELEGDGAAVVPASGHTPYLCAYPPFSHLQWCAPQATYHAIGYHSTPGYVKAHSGGGLDVTCNSKAGFRGTTDAMAFIMSSELSRMTLNQDFAISTRITALQSDSGKAFAGIAMRETMSPKSAGCILAITKDKGIEMQFRSSYGGQAVNLVSELNLGRDAILKGDPVGLKMISVGGMWSAMYRIGSYGSWMTVPINRCDLMTSLTYSPLSIGLAGAAVHESAMATIHFDKVAVSTWNTHDII